MTHKSIEVRRAYKREWARRHYVPRPKVDPELRVFSHVDASGDCWEWTGTRSIGGRYGAVRWEGRMRPAHRVVWEVLVGPIASDLELDHLCRNLGCVNPDHLDPVTHRVNSLRGKSPAIRRHHELARAA